MNPLSPTSTALLELLPRLRAILPLIGPPGAQDEVAAIPDDLVSLTRAVHKLEAHLERIHLACAAILPPPPPASPTKNGSPT